MDCTSKIGDCVHELNIAKSIISHLDVKAQRNVLICCKVWKEAFMAAKNEVELVLFKSLLKDDEGNQIHFIFKAQNFKQINGEILRLYQTVFDPYFENNFNTKSLLLKIFDAPEETFLEEYLYLKTKSLIYEGKISEAIKMIPFFSDNKRILLEFAQSQLSTKNNILKSLSFTERLTENIQFKYLLILLRVLLNHNGLANLYFTISGKSLRKIHPIIYLALSQIFSKSNDIQKAIDAASMINKKETLYLVAHLLILLDHPFESSLKNIEIEITKKTKKNDEKNINALLENYQFEIQNVKLFDMPILDIKKENQFTPKDVHKKHRYNFSKASEKQEYVPITFPGKIRNNYPYNRHEFKIKNLLPFKPKDWDLEDDELQISSNKEMLSCIFELVAKNRFSEIPSKINLIKYPLNYRHELQNVAKISAFTFKLNNSILKSISEINEIPIQYIFGKAFIEQSLESLNSPIDVQENPKLENPSQFLTTLEDSSIASDIFSHILKQLTIRDYNALAVTCKVWNSIIIKIKQNEVVPGFHAVLNMCEAKFPIGSESLFTLKISDKITSINQLNRKMLSNIYHLYLRLNVLNFNDDNRSLLARELEFIQPSYYKHLMIKKDDTQGNLGIQTGLASKKIDSVKLLKHKFYNKDQKLTLYHIVFDQLMKDMKLDISNLINEVTDKTVFEEYLFSKINTYIVEGKFDHVRKLLNHFNESPWKQEQIINKIIEHITKVNTFHFLSVIQMCDSIPKNLQSKFCTNLCIALMQLKGIDFLPTIKLILNQHCKGVILDIFYTSLSEVLLKNRHPEQALEIACSLPSEYVSFDSISFDKLVRSIAEYHINDGFFVKGARVLILMNDKKEKEIAFEKLIEKSFLKKNMEEKVELICLMPPGHRQDACIVTHYNDAVYREKLKKRIAAIKISQESQWINKNPTIAKWMDEHYPIVQINPDNINTLNAAPNNDETTSISKIYDFLDQGKVLEALNVIKLLYFPKNFKDFLSEAKNIVVSTIRPETHIEEILDIISCFESMQLQEEFLHALVLKSIQNERYSTALDAANRIINPTGRKKSIQTVLSYRGFLNDDTDDFIDFLEEMPDVAERRETLRGMYF